ncbi:hypothetical protein HY570_01120 [Candidatus Micrarchaeota archaeon]|nr:hypothetical protein [Candidatus Micrarchaeota archaeon]
MNQPKHTLVIPRLHRPLEPINPRNIFLTNASLLLRDGERVLESPTSARLGNRTANITLLSNAVADQEKGSGPTRQMQYSLFYLCLGTYVVSTDLGLTLRTVETNTGHIPVIANFNPEISEQGRHSVNIAKIEFRFGNSEQAFGNLILSNIQTNGIWLFRVTFGELSLLLSSKSKSGKDFIPNKSQTLSVKAALGSESPAGRSFRSWMEGSLQTLEGLANQIFQGVRPLNQEIFLIIYHV